MARKKKARGRPVVYVMPDMLIEGASPEEIAEVVLQAKPPARWKYEVHGISRA